MTQKEAKGFKAINIDISKNHAEAQNQWRYLQDKYLKLDGHACCGYIEFVLQIAKCEKTQDWEKQSDIAMLLSYFNTEESFNTLLNIMTAMERGYY